MHHVHFLGVLLLIFLVWIATKPSKTSGTRFDSDAYDAGFREGRRFASTGAAEDCDRRR